MNNLIDVDLIDADLGSNRNSPRVFVRRHGMDAQGMNVGLHHVSQTAVNELMSGQRPQAGKFVGDDEYLEVSAALAGAGVAGVQMAFIDHFELRGLQRPLQDSANALDAPPAGLHGDYFDASAGIFDASHMP